MIVFHYIPRHRTTYVELADACWISSTAELCVVLPSPIIRSNESMRIVGHALRNETVYQLAMMHTMMQ
jgi:hypothetical protein